MPQVVREEARFDRRDDANGNGDREKRGEKMGNHGGLSLFPALVQPGERDFDLAETAEHPLERPRVLARFFTDASLSS